MFFFATHTPFFLFFETAGLRLFAAPCLLSFYRHSLLLRGSFYARKAERQKKGGGAAVTVHQLGSCSLLLCLFLSSVVGFRCAFSNIREGQAMKKKNTHLSYTSDFEAD